MSDRGPKVAKREAEVCPLAAGRTGAK
jgi:hypothetical protein